MIDNNLIKKCESDLGDFGSLMKCQATELLNNYKSLIEQNAELHKELAKLKGDRVFVVNGGKPYDHNPPNDLAM